LNLFGFLAGATLQENDVEALHDFKQILQQFKSANFPEANYHLYTLLHCLGLSKYEIQAYIALVEEGGQEQSVVQIVKKSGVPHPRTYDTLKNLVKYGLITVKSCADKNAKRVPVTYRAFDPSIGLENLFAFFTYAKEEAKKEIQNLTKYYVKAETGIWEVIGRDNIINTIKMLIDETKDEILLTADLPFIQYLRHSLIAAAKRNVIISCVSKEEQGTDINFLLEDIRFIRLKFRVHYPMPYIILDRTHAIQWKFESFNKLRSNDPESTRAQVIDQIELIDTLIDHFFFLNWRLGKSVDTGSEIDLPKRFIHSVNAVEEAENLLNKGIFLDATVKGFRPNTGKAVLINGTVSRYYKNWDSGIFTLYLKMNDGSEVSVGGFAATFEDIAAESITFEQSNSIEIQ